MFVFFESQIASVSTNNPKNPFCLFFFDKDVYLTNNKFSKIHGVFQVCVF